MMTLDEAIRHANRVVHFCEVKASGRDPHSPKFESNIVRNLMKCAEEHKQLVKWLEELKRLKEQEPCEDAISRVETVQFLANHSNDFEDAKVKMTFKVASSLVNNPHYLPPVTPARKKGKWIEVWESQRDEFTGECDEWREHRCSVCGFQELDADRFNYCPNCGAEMEK